MVIVHTNEGGSKRGNTADVIMPTEPIKSDLKAPEELVQVGGSGTGGNSRQRQENRQDVEREAGIGRKRSR